VAFEEANESIKDTYRRGPDLVQRRVHHGFTHLLAELLRQFVQRVVEAHHAATWSHEYVACFVYAGNHHTLIRVTYDTEERPHLLPTHGGHHTRTEHREPVKCVEHRDTSVPQEHIFELHRGLVRVEVCHAVFDLVDPARGATKHTTELVLNENRPHLLPLFPSAEPRAARLCGLADQRVPSVHLLSEDHVGTYSRGHGDVVRRCLGAASLHAVHRPTNSFVKPCAKDAVPLRCVPCLQST